MPVARVIDTSHYNQVASFRAASVAGIWGVINKATERNNYVDDTYQARRRAALDAGMLFGGYHFIRPNVSATVQVEHFLKHAAPKDTELACALDWEDNAVHPDMARSFMELIKSKTGRKPILYSGNTAKELLGTRPDPFFAGHRLWLAQYSSRPICQSSWRTAWLWQFSGDGLGPLPHGVAGVTISGRQICDMNDYVLDDAITDAAVSKINLSREWITDPSSDDQKPNAPQDQIGSRNVKWLQEQLNLLGPSILDVDGFYGDKTKNAVKAFQIAHPPLKADGVFGPRTAAMLDFVLLSRQAVRG